MTTARESRAGTESDLSLRMLMLLHMPWDRNLGAPRVQLELAEEFRSRGHVVEKFAYGDAFPQPASRLGMIFRPSFSRPAKRHVSSVAERFDVIEAHHGNLPFTKSSLGFTGLLVARSSGLYQFYRDFERYERQRWPHAKQGTAAGRWVRRWKSWREAGRQQRSLECADLINVPNEDEHAFVRDELGLGDKCVSIPNGIAPARSRALAAAAAAPQERLADPRVAFIGYWSPRKGSLDLGEIVRHVRRQSPAVWFDFLGTGRCEREVLTDLRLERSDRVTVVPSFDSDELPRLLSPVTAGLLPSYIEGFGLGVLEQLAAGIPVVAYDVPGPRQILAALDDGLLTPMGDPAALAAQVTDLVHMPVAAYAALADRCHAIANRYSWSEIAEQTLAVYSDRLARVRTAR